MGSLAMAGLLRIMHRVALNRMRMAALDQLLSSLKSISVSVWRLCAVVSIIAATVRRLTIMELLAELVVMQSGKEGGEAFHIHTAQP